MSVRLIGFPCEDPHKIGCKAPAKFYNLFCPNCWMGMTESERKAETYAQENDSLEKIPTEKEVKPWKFRPMSGPEPGESHSP